MKFVLDSGGVKTIMPKDAMPGVRMGRSNGGFFRVVSGDTMISDRWS